ncbi:hypothetical protein HDU93_007133 [Gonapodya sp. JEL0774]|nr:hypothetical protein HDU93_007133 [Gonapodya sp. JEL0774]
MLPLIHRDPYQDTAKYALIAMGGAVALILLILSLTFPARYIMTTKREKSIAARRERTAQQVAAQGGPRGPPPSVNHLNSDTTLGVPQGYGGNWATMSDDASDVGSVGTRTSRYSTPPNFNMSPAEARKRVQAIQQPVVVEGGFMAGARFAGRMGLRERPSADGYHSDGSGTMFGEDDER